MPPNSAASDWPAAGSAILNNFGTEAARKFYYFQSLENVGNVLVRGILKDKDKLVVGGHHPPLPLSD